MHSDRFWLAVGRGADQWLTLRSSAESVDRGASGSIEAVADHVMARASADSAEHLPGTPAPAGHAPRHRRPPERSTHEHAPADCLNDWIARGRGGAQIVSIAQTSVWQLVQNGDFLEGLFYRSVSCVWMRPRRGPSAHTNRASSTGIAASIEEGLVVNNLIGSAASSNRQRRDRSRGRSDAKVLITGETGTGKEVIAKSIHQRSARRLARLVTLNCAGVPIRCSNQSCSATSGAALPARIATSPAFSRGRQRHGVPGRSRRDEPADAGGAPPVPRDGRAAESRRRPRAWPRQRADRRGDQPRFRGPHRVGRVPAGSVLPPERDWHSHGAAARSARRHPDAAGTLHRVVQPRIPRRDGRRSRSRRSKSWPATNGQATCAS